MTHDRDTGPRAGAGPPEAAAAHRELWGELEPPPTHPLPFGFADRVMARVRDEVGRGPLTVRLGRVPAALASAAALVLGLVVGAGLGTVVPAGAPGAAAPAPTAAPPPAAAVAGPGAGSGGVQAATGSPGGPGAADVGDVAAADDGDGIETLLAPAADFAESYVAALSATATEAPDAADGDAS